MTRRFTHSYSVAPFFRGGNGTDAFSRVVSLAPNVEKIPDARRHDGRGSGARYVRNAREVKRKTHSGTTRGVPRNRSPTARIAAVGATAGRRVLRLNGIVANNHALNVLLNNIFTAITAWMLDTYPARRYHNHHTHDRRLSALVDCYVHDETSILGILRSVGDMFRYKQYVMDSPEYASLMPSPFEWPNYMTLSYMGRYHQFNEIGRRDSKSMLTSYFSSCMYHKVYNDMRGRWGSLTQEEVERIGENVIAIGEKYSSLIVDRVMVYTKGLTETMDNSSYPASVYREMAKEWTIPTEYAQTGSGKGGLRGTSPWFADPNVAFVFDEKLTRPALLAEWTRGNRSELVRAGQQLRQVMDWNARNLTLLRETSDSLVLKRAEKASLDRTLEAMEERKSALNESIAKLERETVAIAADHANVTESLSILRANVTDVMTNLKRENNRLETLQRDTNDTASTLGTLRTRQLDIESGIADANATLVRTLKSIRDGAGQMSQIKERETKLNLLAEWISGNDTLIRERTQQLNTIELAIAGKGGEVTASVDEATSTLTRVRAWISTNVTELTRILTEVDEARALLQTLNESRVAVEARIVDLETTEEALKNSTRDARGKVDKLELDLLEGEKNRSAILEDAANERDDLEEVQKSHRTEVRRLEVVRQWVGGNETLLSRVRGHLAFAEVEMETANRTMNETSRTVTLMTRDIRDVLEPRKLDLQNDIAILEERVRILNATALRLAERDDDDREGGEGYSYADGGGWIHGDRLYYTGASVHRSKSATGPCGYWRSSYWSAVRANDLCTHNLSVAAREITACSCCSRCSTPSPTATVVVAAHAKHVQRVPSGEGNDGDADAESRLNEDTMSSILGTVLKLFISVCGSLIVAVIPGRFLCNWIAKKKKKEKNNNEPSSDEAKKNAANDGRNVRDFARMWT